MMKWKVITGPVSRSLSTTFLLLCFEPKRCYLSRDINHPMLQFQPQFQWAMLSCNSHKNMCKAVSIYILLPPSPPKPKKSQEGNQEISMKSVNAKILQFHQASRRKIHSPMAYPIASSLWICAFLAFLTSDSLAFLATLGTYGLNLRFGAPQTARFSLNSQWSCCQ